MDTTINAGYYIRKQDLINKAIDKVKVKLLEYSTRASKIEGQWTDDDRERFKDWNNYHDLQHRLENRLRDNWSNYHDWHFETFGWNSYSVG